MQRNISIDMSLTCDCLYCEYMYFKSKPMMQQNIHKVLVVSEIFGVCTYTSLFGVYRVQEMLSALCIVDVYKINIYI